jgi:hypothetical protein
MYTGFNKLRIGSIGELLKLTFGPQNARSVTELPPAGRPSAMGLEVHVNVFTVVHNCLPHYAAVRAFSA